MGCGEAERHSTKGEANLLALRAVSVRKVRTGATATDPIVTTVATFDILRSSSLAVLPKKLSETRRVAGSRVTLV